MPSPGLLTLAEFLLLRPFGERPEVLPREAPRGGRVALAYSGGVDSSAAPRLLPGPIPIHTQVARVRPGHVLDNALLAVAEVGGLPVASSQDELGLPYGRRPGFWGHGGFTVTAVLLADHLGLSAVADGNVMERVYMNTAAGSGTGFAPRNRGAIHAAFRRAGLD